MCGPIPSFYRGSACTYSRAHYKRSKHHLVEVPARRRRARSAAADRLAEGIRHHVARKRDDAKLMDATLLTERRSINWCFVRRAHGRRPHPDDACRRRTWYTLAKLAARSGASVLLSTEAPRFGTKKGSGRKPRSMRQLRIISEGRRTARGRSFLRAEARWRVGGRRSEICTQLVQHVGSRQRGSAMMDDDDEVCEERRRILRRDI